MNQITLKPHHLTDDETVEFPSHDGTMIGCRLRVWRRVGAASIVLASQLIDESGQPQIMPSRIVNGVANYAHSALLGYPLEGFLYIEALRGMGTWDLRQVSFSYFGQSNQRLRLYSPVRHMICVEVLEHMIGQRVEDLHS